MGKYDNIIHMDRPMDPKHPPMSMHNRAAQFAPFDALTGFNGRIYEVSRPTDPRIELSEDQKQEISTCLHEISERLAEYDGVPLHVTITYFIPDKTKDGGAYQTRTAAVTALRPYDEKLILEDRTAIDFGSIMNIEIVDNPSF